MTNEESTKLIVFGATGNTGIAIIRTALKQGLQVSAFVRTPSKIPEDIRSKVNVITGDVKDRNAVADAVNGHHVVLSSLGTGWSMAETTVISGGCKNIVSGMKRCGIKRIGVVGTSFIFPNEWTPFWLRKTVADHSRQIEFLKTQNDIDWFVMMPPYLHASNRVGNYIVSKDRVPGIPIVTTHEVVDFMVSCIIHKTSMDHYKKSLIGISSRSSVLPESFTIKKVLSCTFVIISLSAWYWLAPRSLQTISEKFLSKVSNMTSDAVSYLKK